MSSPKIILSWVGKEVLVGNRPGATVIGKWGEAYHKRVGRTEYRGWLNGGTQWSPWMKKKELRVWFAEQIKSQEARGQ